jgi:hypothetical protein
LCLATFSLLQTEKNKPKQPSKIKIPQNNTLSIQGCGELGNVTRLRGQLNRCRPNEPEPDNTGGGKNEWRKK